MTPADELQLKLKKCEPEIRAYVAALEKENLKLVKQIARQQAQHVTDEHRIATLQDEVERLNHDLSSQRVAAFVNRAP